MSTTILSLRDLENAAWTLALDGFVPQKANMFPLKRDYFDRKYIFQPSFFRGNVSFQGVNIWVKKSSFDIWLGSGTKRSHPFLRYQYRSMKEESQRFISENMKNPGFSPLFFWLVLAAVPPGCVLLNQCVSINDIGAHAQGWHLCETGAMAEFVVVIGRTFSSKWCF